MIPGIPEDALLFCDKIISTNILAKTKEHIEAVTQPIVPANPNGSTALGITSTPAPIIALKVKQVKTITS